MAEKIVLLSAHLIETSLLYLTQLHRRMQSSHTSPVSQAGSYAVLDSGYKYIYDRFNDKYRYIPCNGDIAGLCVQTSLTAEDWYSPAGLQRGNLRNAIKLAYTPTKAHRDELYLQRINPVTSFPGQGIVLFGDKTAQSTLSSFDRINVRRLFLNIERRVQLQHAVSYSS